MWNLTANWSTGEITSVEEEGQAKTAGVQSSWVFHSIDGEPYSEQLLVGKIGSGCPYNITFDASKEDADQQKEGVAVRGSSGGWPLPQSSHSVATSITLEFEADFQWAYLCMVKIEEEAKLRPAGTVM